MSVELKEVLEHPTCKIEDTTNLPAEIFRELCFTLNLNPSTWDKLLTKYLDTVDGGSLSKGKRSRERNNINRELSNNSITWNKLTQFLSILKPSKVKYTLDLKWNIKAQSELLDNIKLGGRYKGNILKTFFTKAFDSAIDNPKTWDVLVNRWIDKLEDINPENPVDRSTERGNIQKTIRSRDNFTWELFCKAMAILGVGSMGLTLHLTVGDSNISIERTIDPHIESVKDKGVA